MTVQYKEDFIYLAGELLLGDDEASFHPLSSQ